ncbi:MAG: hypothetical protein AAF623_18340 [Planctomycetota bacterium]
MSILFFLTCIAFTGSHQAQLDFDQACGARCAIHVLKKFEMGQSCHLIEVVFELDDPKKSRGGTNLDRICRFLDSKGLKVLGVKKSYWHDFNDEVTYIVHVTKANGRNHFLVREPDENGQPVYWDGLDGFFNNLPAGYEESGFLLAVTNQGDAEPLVLSNTRISTSAFVFVCLIFVSSRVLRRKPDAKL